MPLALSRTSFHPASLNLMTVESEAGEDNKIMLHCYLFTHVTCMYLFFLFIYLFIYFGESSELAYIMYLTQLIEHVEYQLKRLKLKNSKKHFQ